MSEFKDLYRGYVIMLSASGPDLQGPCMAGYSVWRLAGDGKYEAVLQGDCDRATFPTSNEAFAAAGAAAKAAVDKLLDA